MQVERKRSGRTEDVSVLGVAAAFASYLGPQAEAWSPGLGQAVTMLIMAVVPYGAKLIRDRMGKTIGEKLQGELGKARDVLIVLVVAGGLLGCQMTRIDEDGSMAIVSWGDVHFTACSSVAGAPSLEPPEEPQEPVPGCVTIREGGMSSIMGGTLGKLFDAALAVIGRTIP